MTYTNSFDNIPPTRIGFDDPVATSRAGGTPSEYAPGYTLGPGEGPATWFRRSLITMKARKRDTDGQFALAEWYAPRGLCAPGHSHPNEAEFFTILDGELDVTCGDTVYHATPGSYVYIPKATVHDIVVTTAKARFTVLITPAGFEHWFEELGTAALAPTFPYSEHEGTPSFEEMEEVGEKYGWTPATGIASANPDVPRTEPLGRLNLNES
ncbi:cupin domain-containing protein [Rhodococcus sp. T2V]|uniref:cupin domain-containing protein n=1 Tax=Rhodococcus sp. T2V TaxID=3034164 RepID=UPI0023E34DA5|nr:cupin domain-containing protein [Rhodococcus sp. T2V]MDF3313168.1 cupin domain-containing protein [Rhodococcus sp. T2V]